MPGAGGAQLQQRGEGEETAGQFNAVLADDHRAVMERRMGSKDGEQQVLADVGVDLDRLVDIILDINLPLDGDNGADFRKGEGHHGIDDLIDHLGLVRLGVFGL